MRMGYSIYPHYRQSRQNLTGYYKSRNGRLYFSTIEPFGKTLDRKMAEQGISQNVRESVVYQQLYDITKIAAQQIPELNRFKIKGVYQSSVTSEISLNAEYSRRFCGVTAGGQILTEGVQYTVDYNLGRLEF